jgi:hypothetical protein
MSGNEKEQERLFYNWPQGGTAVRRSNAKSSDFAEAVQSEAPLIVTMLLAGPSVDFIVGRIFESATSDAYDDVFRRRRQAKAGPVEPDCMLKWA